MAAEHVIHISVDGLHGQAINLLGKQAIPNFFRLRDQGLTTELARTDPVYTYTLPNHTSMMTGRIVEGGHQWEINQDPGAPITIHSNAGSYITSIFDVVHDAGMSTSLFTGKDKFAIFDRSWDGTNGADDTNGVDNGKDKIDRYYYEPDTQLLVAEFISDLGSFTRNYAFLHIRDPDSTGHASSWDLSPGSAYMESVSQVDNYIGDILNFVESNPRYKNSTAVILVADHGGTIGGTTHHPQSYQSHIIPFYLWGDGIAQNENIYSLNRCLKPPEEISNPEYRSEPFNDGMFYVFNGFQSNVKKVTVVYLDDMKYQPIRNGDSANVAVSLLGLDSIPGSQLKSVTRVELPVDHCDD